MKFRNKNTGHILHVHNGACISMMQASTSYEVVTDDTVKEVESPEAVTAVVEAPIAEEAAAVEAPKPKAKSKSKAKK